MLDIHYISNPGNACALACYTMTAKYFFPEKTFKEIAKISNWEPGYVVWGFKFWLWIMDKGIRVTDYDLADLQKWSNEGMAGLRESISETEFNFLKNNTKDLESYSSDIKKVLNHPNFTYHRRKATFADLEEAFQKGAVCEVVLNPKTLNGKDGYGLHRVVVLDITDQEIIFHDPSKNNPKPKRRESRELFEKAWLGINEPELCIYSKNL